MTLKASFSPKMVSRLGGTSDTVTNMLAIQRNCRRRGNEAQTLDFGPNSEAKVSLVTSSPTSKRAGQLTIADSSVNTEDRGYFYDAAWNLNRRTNNGVSSTFTVNSLNELTNAA